MITPIQPVAWNTCPPSLPCDLRFSLACALTFRTLYGCWFCPAVVIEHAGDAVPAPPASTPDARAKRCDSETDTLAWRAWPTTLSRIAGPTRWWPASELPPIPPPPAPSVRPLMIHHPPTYGQLDFWA